MVKLKQENEDLPGTNLTLVHMHIQVRLVSLSEGLIM